MPSSVIQAGFRSLQYSNLSQSLLSPEAIQAIYHKFADPFTSEGGGLEGGFMTTEGFTSFLISSDNMALDEKHQRVCDNMQRPLCEYYISSSHNVDAAFRIAKRFAS